jgi:hypothetical protein
MKSLMRIGERPSPPLLNSLYNQVTKQGRRKLILNYHDEQFRLTKIYINCDKKEIEKFLIEILMKLRATLHDVVRIFYFVEAGQPVLYLLIGPYHYPPVNSHMISSSKLITITQMEDQCLKGGFRTRLSSAGDCLTLLSNVGKIPIETVWVEDEQKTYLVYNDSSQIISKADIGICRCCLFFKNQQISKILCFGNHPNLNQEIDRFSFDLGDPINYVSLINLPGYLRWSFRTIRIPSLKGASRALRKELRKFERAKAKYIFIGGNNPLCEVKIELNR